MIGGIQNIGRITELRDRILFTFAMLAVYRVGAVIVTPGINPDVVRNFFKQMQGLFRSLKSLGERGRGHKSHRPSRPAGRNVNIAG